MKRLKYKQRQTRQALLWMSPALLLVLFATIYPLIFSIDYSLYRTNIFSKVKFVGLQNYKNLLSDERFWINVYNSLVFTFVGIAITYLLGLLVTLLLRKPSKFHSCCRTILLIPWVTNEVVLALMWVWILNTQMSPLYYFAGLIGVTLPDFFNSPQIALATITILNAIRSLGFSLVMLMAAFAGIPQEVEEAADIDGCGKCQKVWYIILPLIKPVSMVMIIVLTISFFNIVTFILTMTGGGPVYATETLPLRLYKEGFIFFNINIASTLTTIMLIVNLGFAAVYKKIASAESYY